MVRVTYAGTVHVSMGGVRVCHGLDGIMSRRRRFTENLTEEALRKRVRKRIRGDALEILVRSQTN